MITKSLTGAKIKLYINSSLFAIATDIDYTIDYGRSAIYGLDRYTPFELAPGQVSVRGSVKCVRLHFGGSLEDRGVVAPESQLLSEKYISIQLVDRLTDRVLIKIDKAAVSRQSWNVESKNIVKGSFEFEGLTMLTEAEVND